MVNVSEHIILNKIFIIRDKKVMIDRDLAEMYGVETRVLNQAVKRNCERFPEDFMFQFNDQDFENWKSQFVISNKEKMGIRNMPYAFTEQGVAMLSSVLNSKQAIQVNIQIIRIFTKMRELLLSHREILLKLNQLEMKLTQHDDDIAAIFNVLKKLLIQKNKPTQKIGFKTGKQ